MPPRDDTHLRDAWIAFHQAADGTPEHEAMFWAWERVGDLCSKEPEEAFAFILVVLAHGRSDRILANFAAGPLEDLLAQHAHRMIERVEEEARSNPQFAHLLGGVWQNAIPDDVWRRIQAVTPAHW
jgi:hypothetical protein